MVFVCLASDLPAVLAVYLSALPTERFCCSHVDRGHPRRCQRRLRTLSQGSWTRVAKKEFVRSRQTHDICFVELPSGNPKTAFAGPWPTTWRRSHRGCTRWLASSERDTLKKYSLTHYIMTNEGFHPSVSRSTRKTTRMASSRKSSPESVIDQERSWSSALRTASRITHSNCCWRAGVGCG
jgi:hypothetical protein